MLSTPPHPTPPPALNRTSPSTPFAHSSTSPPPITRRWDSVSPPEGRKGGGNRKKTPVLRVWRWTTVSVVVGECGWWLRAFGQSGSINIWSAVELSSSTHCLYCIKYVDFFYLKKIFKTTFSLQNINSGNMKLRGFFMINNNQNLNNNTLLSMHLYFFH